ncbi:MAG TPA: sigma-70 family RNA polymerase sigma factor [Labilithrix sp.]|nr:sigma-70 family RNA polymerase sigma factor [Labilithrix sp.]
MSEGLSNDEVLDLYRRYGAFLRRRCLLLLRHSSLADDAFQEVFVKLMRAGSGVRAADEPLRWLYRVADRTCFDQLRKTKLARRASSIDDASIELPCHPGTEPEMRRAAIELLDALDDEDQRIAVMAFVDGMNQQEIADELGYSRMTIIKRIARLRERAMRVVRDRMSTSVPTKGAPS